MLEVLDPEGRCSDWNSLEGLDPNGWFSDLEDVLESGGETTGGLDPCGHYSSGMEQ